MSGTFNNEIDKIDSRMSATLSEPATVQHRMDPIAGLSEGTSGSDFHAHLQRFVVAKSQIINVYKEMSSYVNDVNKQV